jgi:hypothetical protein
VVNLKTTPKGEVCFGSLIYVRTPTWKAEWYGNIVVNLETTPSRAEWNQYIVVNVETTPRGEECFGNVVVK